MTRRLAPELEARRLLVGHYAEFAQIPESVIMQWKAPSRVAVGSVARLPPRPSSVPRP